MRNWVHRRVPALRCALPVLIAAALASACGGGGGGGSARDEAGGSGSPPPPPPPPSMANCVRTFDLGCISEDAYRQRRRAIEAGRNDTLDFRNQWGLRAIRTDRAYAELELRRGTGAEPGAGQTVGLFDTGIDAAHPVFDGKTVTETILPGATDETGEGYSHGTAVASVIAARPSDSWIADKHAPRGVAWGADVAMFAAPTVYGLPLYEPITSLALAGADAGWAYRIDLATGWSSGGQSLDFVNVSLGIEGIVEQYSAEGLRADFGDSIAALAQAGSTDKTVFVWAAGNAEGLNCDAADFTAHPDFCVDGKVNARSVQILSGLQARIPELRGHSIAVVAVAPDRDGDGDYEIADFSNRCGIAAEWCIAAPGHLVRVAYFGYDLRDNSPGGRDVWLDSGTSFAAPMVTGGLVVMKHYFRGQLSNTALVARMMATANKTGIYADSAIYGQGLLDLGAATAPVGVVAIATGDRADGPGNAVAGSRLAAGGALGNGLARALAGHEIATFDSLGAPFWMPLGAFAGTHPRPSAAGRLRAFRAPREDGGPGVLRPGFAPLAAGDRLSLGVMRATSPGMDAGHLSLAGGALALRADGQDGLAVAAFSTEGVEGQKPASGATLSWRPSEAPVGLTGGWVAERETVLGSSAAGAFGRLSGDAAFAGIEGSARIGAWKLGAGAEIGTVRAAVRGGMLAGISPLATSAFAVEAEREIGDGDGLRVSLAQPLRVEAGRARLSVPVGRSKDGRVLRRAVSAGLEPSGRQIDIAAQWRRTLAAGGELRLGAGWTVQPGHDAAADPELSLLAGWRYAF